MTVTIHIESEVVDVRRGVSKRTGKDYEIREQRCVVHGAGRFPQETRLTLPDSVPGYKQGIYEVTTPFVVGRFGLEVSRDLGLVLVKAQARAA